MNKYKELRLIEELMVELINAGEEETSYYSELEDAQLKLLETLDIK